MRKSNKFLLGVIAVIAIAIVAFAIVARVVVERNFDVTKTPRGERIRASEEYETKEYDFSGVKRIETTGNWNVKLVDSDDSVTIEYPENLKEYLEIEFDGETLELKISELTRIAGLDSLRATIPGGEVAKVSSAGMLHLSSASFDFDRFEADTAGSFVFSAPGATFAFLDIESSGIAKYDLASATIVSAHVEISGAGTGEFTMAGGSLTGDLSGASTITYSGSISELDVDTSGVSRVESK